jgi:hypothetical protein
MLKQPQPPKPLVRMVKQQRVMVVTSQKTMLSIYRYRGRTCSGRTSSVVCNVQQDSQVSRIACFAIGISLFRALTCLFWVPFSCRKLLVFLQKTVAILAPINPELAFKLYLEIAAAIDLLAYSIKRSFESSSNEFSSISYDFLTQASLVYEDKITESSVQVRVITSTSIVGTLLSCRTFEKADLKR